MERTQEGALTESEICKFWTALSGQEVKTSSEIPEVGIQGMIGKTEADLREFLTENGPAIFGRLPEAEEEGDEGADGDTAGDAATEVVPEQEGAVAPAEEAATDDQDADESKEALVNELMSLVSAR